VVMRIIFEYLIKRYIFYYWRI